MLVTVVLHTDYYVWSNNIDVAPENTILFPYYVRIFEITRQSNGKMSISAVASC